MFWLSHGKLRGRMLSFQNVINDFFSSTAFIKKVKEGSHKGRKIICFFLGLFFETNVFEVVIFLTHVVVIQSTQFFSCSTYL